MPSTVPTPEIPPPDASILHGNLASGFATLAANRSVSSSSGVRRQGSRRSSAGSATKKGQEEEDKKEQDVQDLSAAASAAASISFIDPSTPASTATASTSTSTPSGSKDPTTSTTKRVTGLIKTDHEKGLRLYEKVSTILERDYSDTLHGVPYTNLRTGAAERIDVLPVKPFLSGGSAAGGGGAASSGGSKGGASGGAAAALAAAATAAAIRPSGITARTVTSTSPHVATSITTAPRSDRLSRPSSVRSRVPVLAIPTKVAAAAAAVRRVWGSMARARAAAVAAIIGWPAPPPPLRPVRLAAAIIPVSI